MALLSFEKKYRVRGGTLIGGDLFDFWVGPFYVGFFGVTTFFFSVLGQPHPGARPMQGDVQSLDDQHRAARPELRSGPCAARRGRADWQIITVLRDRRLRVVDARQVEISRKLGMGYHVPFAFGVAIFAYVTLVVIRPSCSARGGTVPLRHLQPPRLGVERRLPVPALPLQPGAHDRGDVLLHHDAGAGASRRSDPVCRQPEKGEDGEDPEHETRSSGTSSATRSAPLGIHRLGLFLALNAGFWSADVHRHQRPVLDLWLARVVELVAELPIWPEPELYDSTGLATYGTNAAIVGGN
jgi:photosynthetic reaction center L subunit